MKTAATAAAYLERVAKIIEGCLPAFGPARMLNRIHGNGRKNLNKAGPWALKAAPALFQRRKKK
jgi:hypothetical protein